MAYSGSPCGADGLGSISPLRNKAETVDTFPMKHLEGNVSHWPRRFAITLLAWVLVASVGSARPGMVDYWKAGTKRKSSSTIPRESRTSRSPTPVTSSAPTPKGPVPWTGAWFSDPKLVAEHVHEMSEAIRVPLIGERFPLPRGGGVPCTPVDPMSSPAVGDMRRVVECSGPDLGGERWNEFYAPSPEAAPTLEHVRWRIQANAPAHVAPWRQVFTALRDSLSGSIGAPTWTSPDSLALRWDQDGHHTTIRLHVTAARADSLEITCVSDRISGTAGTLPPG